MNKLDNKIALILGGAGNVGEFTAWLASDAASMVNSSVLRLYEKAAA